MLADVFGDSAVDTKCAKKTSCKLIDEAELRTHSMGENEQNIDATNEDEARDRTGKLTRRQRVCEHLINL